MVSEASALAKQQGKPYEVVRDERTKVWRIYDLNDPIWLTLTSDDEAPDDNHPSVTILTDSAFWEIVKVANSLDLLSRVVVTDNKKLKELEETNYLLKDELSDLRDENKELKLKLEMDNKELPVSDNVRVQLEAMNIIKQIVGINAVQK